MRIVATAVLAATIFTTIGSKAIADVALITSAKLRTYCAGCHGLGELRFIPNQDDRDTWAFIFNNRSPKSGKIWAEVIADTLSWPSDTPPPANELMIPPHRDWMPKGAKRQELASDSIAGESTRMFVIRALRK